jgi:hypothetical protein
MRRTVAVLLGTAALLCAVAIPASADNGPGDGPNILPLQLCNTVGNVLGSHQEQGDCG